MNTPRFRSPRDYGPGALRKDVGGWLLERATALVLAPLTVWFAGSVIAHTDSDYGALIKWLQMPLNAVLMALLLIMLFWHTALGLAVVIQDYVHAIARRTVALTAMRLACLVFTVAGIVAIVRIALQAS